MKNIKVLCVTDYYLPGYKAGGPIRTIANMSDILAGEVEFSIVTRDRDLGDDTPFDSVRVGEWQTVGNSSVFYASPEEFGASAAERTFNDHDVLYLNSFFSFRGSIEPYLKLRNRAQILIAPRGEFSKGALALKPVRKRLFLGLAKLLGLYRHVQWHASSAMEASDIERTFPGSKGQIHLAIDPVVMGPRVPVMDVAAPCAELKVAFISRISPMKNLDGLLALLKGINRPIVLNIYGPIEDKDYWDRCQGIMGELPEDIRVVYCGILDAEEVSSEFAKHDLFAFPTRGENFGHVIFESLRAGTPVLLSDQTPWKSDPSGSVTVVPLDSPERWRAQIEAAADLSSGRRQTVRRTTIEYAQNYALKGETRLNNLRMFERVARVNLQNQVGGPN